ncbi:MAG: cytochrome C, partial [Gammaproteobacteria bacterium]|nr:cytochrome C [Gammaproteobacteria bacterium]
MSSRIRSACRASILPSILLAAVMVISSAAQAIPSKPAPPTSTSTADHSKFKELQQAFKTGPEVTKACLGCHTEASKQLHKTKHWNWKFTNPDNGEVVGKKTIV